MTVPRSFPSVLSLLVPLSLAHAQAPVYDATHVELGGGVHDLAVADWSGDGVPDLAAVDATRDLLILSVGRGNGAFDAPTTLAMTDPAVVLAADLDGNSTPDLVAVEDLGAQKNVVALISDGLGGTTQVTSAWALSADLFVQDLACEDVNLDGNADLVVLLFRTASARFEIGEVQTLLGDGAGGFTPSGVVRPVGELPRGMVTGDFNEDGFVDAAVVNNGSNDLTVLFGDATGSFASSSTIFLGMAAFRVESADLDQDGHLDLGIGTSTSVLGLAYGDGMGGFSTSTLSSPFAARELALADVNGDGWIDVIGGSSYPSVFLSDTTGGFLSPIDSYVSGVNSMTTADLDSDGNVDLVVGRTTEGASTVLGDGSGSFANLVRFDETVSWVRSADFDGNGHSDLYYQRGDIGGLAGFSVRMAQGDGTFSAESIVPTTYSSVVVLPVDWNGDGVLDLASANLKPATFFDPSMQSLAVYTGDGAGSFTLADEVTLAHPPTALEAGDLNSDGLVELFLLDASGGVSSFTVGAGGVLSTPVSLPFFGGADILVADLNQDGALDLARTAAFDVAIHYNDGLGNLAPEVLVPAGYNTKRLFAADVDGDGRRDLIAQSFFRVSLLPAIPGGFAAPIHSGLVSSSFFAPDLELGDVDGDGVLDAVLGGDYAVVVRGLAAGGWAEPEGVTGFASSVALGDWDSDGFLDLAVASFQLDIHPNRAVAPDGVVAFGMGTPGCDGTQLALTNRSPDLGATDFVYTCNNAPPSAFGFIAGSLNPLVQGVQALGVLVHVNPAGPLFSLDLVQSDSNGIARFPVVLPGDPSLAGLKFSRQFVWAWAPETCLPSPRGWSTSRGVEVTLR